MRTKILFALITIITTQLANAATCDLRAHTLDLRDGGLTVEPQADKSFWSNRGVLRECDLTIKTSAVPNPRSSALREFDGLSYKSFSQPIEISEISFKREGGMNFVVFDFFASELTYKLSLGIFSKPIAAGTSSSTSYYLFGTWQSVDESGTVLDERAAFTYRDINVTDLVSIDWKKTARIGNTAERTDLNINVNGYSVPIHTFHAHTDANPYNHQSPWRRDFHLRTKTVGPFHQYNLDAQTSFKLGGSFTCVYSQQPSPSGEVCN